MDIVLSYIQEGFSGVFAFILLLGLLIFVHELGHFAVAKWCGVRVEVFSLGFGKKLFSFKRGDTTYCVSLIPLGGYVKMFGDEVGAQLPESEKKFSFTHKPVSRRIAIVLAGPLMNFFFAMVIFAIVAFMGEDVRSPIVGDLNPSSKAFQVGFRSGDRIISVGGAPVASWEQFQESLNHGVNSSIEVKVQHPGATEPEVFQIRPETRPNPNILSLTDTIGDVDGLTHLSKAAVIGVRTGLPAEKAGLRTGDRILAVNGVEARHFRQLEPMLLPFQKQEVTLQIERDTEAKKQERIEIKANLGQFASLKATGLESSDLYLYKVSPGTPAEQAGLLAGDRILKINNSVTQVWEDVLHTIKAYSGSGQVEMIIERAGIERTISVQPQMTSQMNASGGEEKRYTIGIVPWVHLSPPELTTLPIQSIGHGLLRGVTRTWDVTVMTAVSFLRLIRAEISPRNIGGVISIGQAAHETLKIGLTHFLTMMGAISVNLFVLNLLPIPVLDGGHLLFYTIEALRGAPLNMRKMEIAQQVGLFVLMSLMVFALFNDVTRIFGIW